MYKGDKRGKPILFISVFYKNTSVQDKEKKSELKLYTACLPSEVKLKPQASNIKEICYVDALFMEVGLDNL